jgi:hypothetical protein
MDVRMSVQAVLAPLFVQVALTFALMFWMGYLRITSLRQRQTRVPDIALGERNWPPRTLQAANAFGNQFQLPVLFYVLVVLALIMHKADLIFVVLSWVFVISRILHAGIHVTTNTVSQRFTLYLVGAIVLLLMWAIFAVQIMLFV